MHENERKEMIRILFVCHGNICRSPLAEFYMKKLVRDMGRENDFFIASAATSTEEIWNGVGATIYPPMQRTMKKYGLPYDPGKRAELLVREDYARYDLLIGMDHRNLVNMRRLFKGDPEGKIHLLMEYPEGVSADHVPEVSDPWYSGDFEATWRDVSAGCKALLSALL